MQLKIITDRDTTIIPVDVTKIEVEEMSITSEDEVVGNCYRTIRFVGFNGEALEVFCTGFDEHSVMLHSVKQLKPVPKPDVKEGLTPSKARPKK
jgi:hypothetical protein